MTSVAIGHARPGALRRFREWMAGAPRLRGGTRMLQVTVALFWYFRLTTEGPFFAFLWGPDGIGQGRLTSRFGPAATPLDAVFASDASTFLLLLAMGVAATALLIGRHTRIAALGLLAGQTLLENRFSLLSNGSDHLCRLVLGYLVLVMPPREHAKPGSLAVWLNNVGVIAIIAQLGVVYLTSGTMKALGPKWQDGTAMYYISQVQWLSQPWMRDLFLDPVIVTVATISPMIYQLLFPIAILSPLRLPWIAIGIGFHLLVAVMMGLFDFSLLMTGLTLLLVRDSEFARLRGAAKKAVRRLTAGDIRQPTWAARFVLYYDGWCLVCRRIVARLRGLDVTHELEPRSFRSDLSWRDQGIAADALEREMHLVSLDSGEVVTGFAAVERIVGVVPPLWPLWLLVVIARWTGLGPWAYRLIAASRTIVPDPARCGDHCEVQSSEAAAAEAECRNGLQRDRPRLRAPQFRHTFAKKK